MELMDVLKGQLSDDMLGQLSQYIGAEPQQTASAAEGIFATLLGGLANNASNENGLSALGNALDRDHDGSMLDDLMGMVGGMMQGGQATGATNGLGILGHILGDRQETAAEQIGQSSGLNMSQVMKLMPILAPILMNVLGRAKSQGNLGLGDLAGVLMGSAQQAQQGGMGDLIGAVLGSVLGGQQAPQQSAGGGLLGSVLGGIFGRR
ncbi:MAG: DUF937 domain-containing protein [Saprospiraceae bacterium]|nr:DUF937 domain-containing protein [Saprospiraceae bacterium]